MRRSASDVRSARPSPNRRRAALQALQPAGQADAPTLQRGQVDVALDRVRTGASDELQGGFAAGRVGIGHLVDGAREPAGGLEPPEDVHAAVAAGHPGVPADREDDVPARPGELVGDLHPRRRGADHQHATRGPGGSGLRYRLLVITRTSARPTAAGTRGVPCGPVATTTERGRHVP